MRRRRGRRKRGDPGVSSEEGSGVPRRQTAACWHHQHCSGEPGATESAIGGHLVAAAVQRVGSTDTYTTCKNSV